MLRSLTMRSELLTLSGTSFLSQHEGFIVQSTPTEPDFWMGNQIILPDTSLSAPEAFKVFEHHFPDATHRSVVWDIPNLDPSFIRDTAALDAEIDGFDALKLTDALGVAEVPAGIDVRSIKTEDDWAKIAELQIEVGIEEGFGDDKLPPYIHGRNAGRRAQIAKNLGQWFGAFDGDRVVASMGIFHDQTIARYQSVETRMTHRRRGICSALLRHAALWALDRAPSADVVIVAEADSNAGRLYRKMGFAHAETIYGALRKGT